MVKAYVCRAAEWVTREAMQLHGGMGYAEEFPVSPLLRRRARAVDLRGRRRDALPPGDRPPARRAGRLTPPQCEIGPVRRAMRGEPGQFRFSGGFEVDVGRLDRHPHLVT